MSIATETPIKESLGAYATTAQSTTTLRTGAARLPWRQASCSLNGRRSDNRSYQRHGDNCCQTERAYHLPSIHAGNDEGRRFNLFLQQIIFGELINCIPNQFLIDRCLKFTGQCTTSVR